MNPITNEDIYKQLIEDKAYTLARDCRLACMINTMIDETFNTDDHSSLYARLKVIDLCPAKTLEIYQCPFGRWINIGTCSDIETSDWVNYLTKKEK